MLPVLSKSKDYASWSRQLVGFFALKGIVDNDKKLEVLPTLIDEEILKFAVWDGKATYESAMKMVKKGHDIANRPANPTKEFEDIKYSDNLYELAVLIQRLGGFINASEETMLRKFISLLPSPLEMAAYQYSPDLSKMTLQKMVDYVTQLPTRSPPCVNAVINKDFDTVNVETIDVCTSQARRNVICYNCGEKNHFSKGCTATAAKCGRCGRRHQTKFHKSNVQNVRAAELLVGGARSSVNNFTVKLLIAHKIFDALVDTGSSVSFINAAILPRDSETLSCDASSRSFSDHVITVRTLCNVTFGLNNTSYTHSFYVLRNCSFVVILGTDFLCEHSFVLDVLSKSIQSNKCSAVYSLSDNSKVTNGTPFKINESL